MSKVSAVQEMVAAIERGATFEDVLALQGVSVVDYNRFVAAQHILHNAVCAKIKEQVGSGNADPVTTHK